MLHIRSTVSFRFRSTLAYDFGLLLFRPLEGATGRPREVAPFEYGSLRRRFSRTYIANNGCDLDLATPHLVDGKADLIAFGRPFVANPNLVERLQSHPG
ncbi:1,2-oxophytodienoate reductase (plasmid) [Agrobacterium tumefaciens]|uniref:1,2-oxophytodienoate reductase n=1 Tax=Agrobacterium tumefaciens TaxID=358 RepID=A0A2L2LMS7_AGRTU|nr:1,2-oxophytodienoate reductase [Agrobacterium tumefaciens]